MENQTKERIAGTAVIVALAVIFVPMIFTRVSPFEVSNVGVERFPKPPTPLQIVRVEPLAQPIVARNDVPAAVPQRVKHQPKPEFNLEFNPEFNPQFKPELEPTFKPAPVIDHSLNVDTPRAWAIQLGSFSRRDNAEALVRKLQDKGFTAFINRTPNENDVTTVLVGPETRKERAFNLAEELEGEMKIKGMVIRYQIT